MLMEGLKSNYRRAVILWAAMMFSIVIYALAVDWCKADVHFLKKDSSSPEVFPLKVFLLSFTVMTLFLIWFVRSHILCGRVSKAFKNPPSRLLFCSLATNLLCETLAITGLTLFLLTRNPLNFYIFLLLSFVLFTYFFPRYAQWEEWAGRTKGIAGSAAAIR